MAGSFMERCGAPEILSSLGSSVDYSTADRSMSPFFSNVGLVFGNRGGIESVCLHYNRRTIRLGDPFLPVALAPATSLQTVSDVRQECGTGSARFAFYGHNSWMVEYRGMPVLFPVPESAKPVSRWLEKAADDDTLFFHLFCSNKDERDPDQTVPVVIALRRIRGILGEGDPLREPLRIDCDASGVALVALSVAVLEIDIDALTSRLDDAPGTIDEAAARTAGWFGETLGEMSFVAHDSRERQIHAVAACALVANSTRAPGLLAEHIAAFPSRGHYPTHYLWDSCFENLALESMAPALAPDALLLLTENLRADGKMAQFITSTWVRPRGSQPPLVGWAGLRLVKKRNDLALARKLLHPLIANTTWWLTQRATPQGLIHCADPLETGWDNTPRLDGGPVIACDMNAYLLMQMRSCAEMASMIGDGGTAREQRALADSFAQKIVDILYDRNNHLFRELLLETGQWLPLKTPACFLPLLGDVPLGKEEIEAMITGHLLNEAEFFGAVPFPSVAYDEEVYSAGHWWRGPTWMPVAYLMLQVLRKFGFHQQYRAAALRLYKVIVNDGQISEFFNSQSGEGKGAKQQGWTAAILLQLNRELFSETGGDR